MMSMQPSGGTRSDVARTQRRCQKAWTHGARSGPGARSVYSTSPPPRKITRGLGGKATDTPRILRATCPFLPGQTGAPRVAWRHGPTHQHHHPRRRRRPARPRLLRAARLGARRSPTATSSCSRPGRWSSRCGVARSSPATAASPRPAAGAGSRSATRSRAPEQVDALCAQAAEAGASVTRPPVEKPFGYSGVFADPDGHTWEIAYVKGLVLHEDGTVALGAAA